MLQSFISHQPSESPHEKDEKILINVTLLTDGPEICAFFERVVKKKTAGGNLQTVREESVSLNNLAAADLGVFWLLISDWRSSRSKPVISETLEEISGVYEKSEEPVARRNNTQFDEFEFSSLNVVLGTAGFAFQIPRGNDHIRFNIPASEVPGHEPKYSNITGLGNLMYDFFDIEFEGSVEDLGIDLSPEIESSERLDEELQRRAVPEFETRHFQSAVRTAFTVLEERVRELGEYPETEYGTGLIQNAFHPQDGQLAFGETTGERDGVMFLYRGAFQALRNPVSHRFLEAVDEDYARDAIYTVNLLLRLLKANHDSLGDRTS